MTSRMSSGSSRGGGRCIQGSGGRSNRYIAQFFKQRLGLLEVERVEPLGEPAVDRRQKLVRLGGLALVPPQPGEAGGGAQLPRLRLSGTGSLDRPSIGGFRPIRGARVPPEE